MLSFTLITYGSLTLGAGYYGLAQNGFEKLLRHISVGAVIAVFATLASTFSDLTLANLVDPAWSSAAKVNPELVYICGFALPATIVLFRFSPGKQLATCCLLVFAIAIMKFRALAIFTMFASCWLYDRIHARRRLLTLLLLTLAISCFLTVLLVDGDRLLRTIKEFSLRGDDPETNLSPTGRLPLWDYAWNKVSMRVMYGYGFGAFWTPTRLQEVAGQIGWNAVFSHNGFLDELLTTGALGLSLMILFWFTLLSRLCSVIAKGGDARNCGLTVVAWIVMLLSFNMMDTIFQFFLKTPFIFSLLGYSAVMVAFSKGKDYAEIA